MPLLDSAMRLFRVPPMSDVQAAKWAEIRTRGRRRYILMNGVLGWGVPMAVTLTIFKKFLFEAPGPFLGRLSLTLVAYSIGGVWFGKKMWADSERRYAEWRRSKADPDQLV